MKEEVKMWRYIYLVLLWGIFIMNHSFVLANGDYINEQAARNAELEMASKIYKQVSGKEPSLSNIIKSLEIVTATEKNKKSEVLWALNILLLKEIRTDKIAKKVIKCHNNNLGDWRIRLKSATFLLNIRKDKGVEFLRLILENPTAELAVRLLAASSLVGIGNLEGYSILREGLMSSKFSERRIALSLLKKYLPYDGRQIDSKGIKIDINQLIDSLGEYLDQILEPYEPFQLMDLPGNETLVNFLITKLDHESSAVRSDTVSALGWMKYPTVAIRDKVKKALISKLKDKDAEVRKNAIRSLSRFGDADVIPFIKPLATKDPYSEIKEISREGRIQKITVYPVREEAKRVLEELKAK